MSSSRMLLQTAEMDPDKFKSMITKKLAEVLPRIEAWPPEAQDVFADFALELNAGYRGGEVEPTAEELAGVDRGLGAAAEGRFATDQQVEAVYAKLRGVFEATRFDAAIERDAKGG